LRELKKPLPLKENSSIRYSRGERLDRSIVVLESKNADELTEQFLNLMQVTQKILKTKDEPMVNVICDYGAGVGV